MKNVISFSTIQIFPNKSNNWNVRRTSKCFSFHCQHLQPSSYQKKKNKKAKHTFDSGLHVKVLMVQQTQPKKNAHNTHFIRQRIYCEYVHIYSVFRISVFIALGIFYTILFIFILLFRCARNCAMHLNVERGKSRSSLSFSIWASSALSLCRFDVASLKATKKNREIQQLG